VLGVILAMNAQFMSFYCSGNPCSIVKVECGINRGAVGRSRPEVIVGGEALCI
jgi:hypothetical protein